MERTPDGQLGVDEQVQEQHGTDIAGLLAAALRDLEAVDQQNSVVPPPDGVARGGSRAVVQTDNFRSAWRNRAKPIEVNESASDVVEDLEHVEVHDEVVVPAVPAVPAVMVPPPPPPPPVSFNLPIPAPLTWATPSSHAVEVLAPQNSFPSSVNPVIAPVAFLPAPAGFPMSTTLQGPGVGWGVPVSYQQNKRKVWPWVLGGCVGVFLLLPIMVIGAVSVLGQKLNESFAALPSTLPSYYTSEPTPQPVIATIPYTDDCGNSPQGTAYFQVVDCALPHDAKVVSTGAFPTATPATDPDVVIFSEACQTIVNALSTSPQDSFVILKYSLPDPGGELHVCVFRQATV